MLGLASLVLFLIGRALGALELMLLGAATLILLVLSIVRALTNRLRLDANRVVTPQRIFQGAPCRVELTLTNHTRRKTPPLRVTDQMEGSTPITFGIPLVRPRTSLTIPYQLSTHQRGRIVIGPLQVTALDPFVLTQASRTLDVLSEVVVYPKIERLAGLPVATGRNLEATSSGRSSAASGGEEFYALRPFEIGDEMRRVHWPSTARFDELHVRQSDMPSQELITVLLDLRNESQSASSLDRAVGFAASICAAAEARGMPVRLVATDGTDSGFISDRVSHNAILDYLATVELGRNTNLGTILNTISVQGAGGALVIVSSRLVSHDRTRIQAMAHQFASITYLMAQDPELPGSTQDNKTYGAAMVLVPPGANFPQLWAQTLARSRSGRIMGG